MEEKKCLFSFFSILYMWSIHEVCVCVCPHTYCIQCRRLSFSFFSPTLWIILRLWLFYSFFSSFIFFLTKVQ